MSNTAKIILRNLTSETLKKAAIIRAKIDRLENQLASLLSSQSNMPQLAANKTGRNAKAGDRLTGFSGNVIKKKKRNLSPEARARIVAAVKARWAREKAQAKK